jgi:precorrin-2 methylase
MRKIYAVGISPSTELITCKALELIKKAPVVLVYNSDFPFNINKILEDKKVVKLKAGFNDPNAIAENLKILNSINEEWGVFLEIGDPNIRSPLFYHILGERGRKTYEIESVPGISSITAVFSRLKINAKHFCMFGSEEEESIANLIGKCDLFVIVNIHKEHLNIFDKLRDNGYNVTFIENCCNENEKISSEYSGNTYWIISIARKSS